MAMAAKRHVAARDPNPLAPNQVCLCGVAFGVAFGTSRGLAGSIAGPVDTAVLSAEPHLGPGSCDKQEEIDKPSRRDEMRAARRARKQCAEARSSSTLPATYREPTRRGKMNTLPKRNGALILHAEFSATVLGDCPSPGAGTASGVSGWPPSWCSRGPPAGAAGGAMTWGNSRRRARIKRTTAGWRPAARRSQPGRSGMKGASCGCWRWVAPSHCYRGLRSPPIVAFCVALIVLHCARAPLRTTVARAQQPREGRLFGASPGCNVHAAFSLVPLVLLPLSLSHSL